MDDPSGHLCGIFADPGQLFLEIGFPRTGGRRAT
jgi:hypothetical protein